MGGLPARETVYGFAVHPKDPRIMYAAMRRGLFRSANGGRNWVEASSGLTNLAGVAIHPKRPEEIYVATMEGIVHRSEDGGKTWKRRN